MASKILVVHSSEPAGAALASVLRDAGYEAGSVSTFEGALKVVTDRCPDLVVTSVRLGRFNGLHLSLRCHTVHPDLPIIVVGVGSDSKLAAEAEGYDVRFVVNPPTHELVKIVRDMLARSIETNLQGPAPSASALHRGGHSKFSFQ